MNKKIYNLCLVTDRDILNGKSLEKAVEDSILGGATMIQLREKNICENEFIEIGKKIKKITDKYNIPLLINDKVNVALEIDANGVHLGQDDMNPVKAREILGENKIIGLSISTLEEFKKSKEYPVDYYGVGPIYPTISKSDAQKPMGLEGLKELRKLTDKPLMAIGGITEENTLEILENGGDGIAVISNILKDENVKRNTKKLKTIFEKKELMEKVAGKIEKLRDRNPLIYHLTNMVTINDCANVTLGIGASPLMSFSEEELEDIIKISEALVLNIGTMDKEMVSMAVKMGKMGNKYKKPIVFDPVGAGATKARKELVEKLMENIKFSVVKGNLAEIKSILNFESESKGVDSLDFSLEDEILKVGKEFYEKYNTVLCITGKNDYIFSKENIIKIQNGHENMGKVTGTGCMTGSLIGSFLGGGETDFLSGILGVGIMGIAGEMGQEESKYLGTGTLRVKIIDKISKMNSKIFLENIKLESI